MDVTPPLPVAFASCTDCRHLAALLIALAAGLDQAPQPRDRIVLVIPDETRAALGWPATAAPIARVDGASLSFTVSDADD